MPAGACVLDIAEQEKTMTKYLFEANYVGEGIKGLMREGGTARRAALTNALNNQTAGQLKDQQAVQTAQQSVNNAQLSYQAAIAAAEVKVQPPKVGDLAAAQSSVASAQVSVETAQKALDDTTLLAPADGTVATLNGVVGQSVPGGGTSTPTTNATTGAATRL